MKISIITPTFNSGSTIGDTIGSILCQSHTDFEHIIVDGVSSDNTLETIRSNESLYAGRLRLISEPDKGIYDAMNKGIALATGDIVGILNSDDYYSSPDVLECIDKEMTPQTEAVFANLHFINPADGRTVRFWKGSPARSFRSGWHPAHPTFYARREVFSKLGGFRTDMRIAADFELMIRFIEKNRISTRYIDRDFVTMRTGGASTANLRNIIRGNREIIRAFRLNGIPVSPAVYPLRRLLPKVADKIKSALDNKMSDS